MLVPASGQRLNPVEFLGYAERVGRRGLLDAAVAGNAARGRCQERTPRSRPQIASGPIEGAAFAPLASRFAFVLRVSHFAICHLPFAIRCLLSTVRTSFTIIVPCALP